MEGARDSHASRTVSLELDERGQRVVLCRARGDGWVDWVAEALTARGLVITETTPEPDGETESGSEPESESESES